MKRTGNEGINKEKTDDVIKKTFQSMYSTMPLDEIKISDLVQAAHVSRGTFYFYYEDIHDLYHKCEEDVLNYMEKPLVDIIIVTINGENQDYIDILSSTMEQWRPNISIMKAFLEGSERDSFRRVWHESLCQKFHKTLKFSKEIPQNKRDILVSFFAAGHQALFADWICSDGKGDPLSIAETSAQILYRGIMNNKDGNE